MKIKCPASDHLNYPAAGLYDEVTEDGKTVVMIHSLMVLGDTLCMMSSILKGA